MSKLIIEEPPLQVLPSLAIAIGLNEAIVLQQLHYLLRDPRFGKRIAEKQWIFNTVEQWRASYFPFWNERTIRRIFDRLSELRLIETCQPEGRISRRKYFRINEAVLTEKADAAKLSSSMRTNCPDGKRTNCPLPITKTSSETSFSETTGLKKTKVTSAVAEAYFVSENELGADIPAEWKPVKGTKAQQLARIEVPDEYPTESEFDEFIADEQLDEIGMGKRADLYGDICRNKWHQWDGRRWRKVRDWEKWVRALNTKMEKATENGGRF